LVIELVLTVSVNFGVGLGPMAALEFWKGDINWTPKKDDDFFLGFYFSLFPL
jgi:hypothetical protein